MIVITNKRGTKHRAPVNSDGLRRFNLPGVDYTHDNLVFDGARYTREMAQVVALAAHGERIEASFAAASAGTLNPTAADMALINAEALLPLAPEEVIVFERYVVNNQPSYSGIVFTNRALDKIAKDFAAGRTRLLHHNRDIPVGATIGAEVVEATVRGIEGKWVKTREFIPTKSISEQDLSLITSGVLRFDSIGISGGEISLIEVEEGDVEHRYIEIDHDPDGLPELGAREVSFVYLGEIRGAGSDKGLGKSLSHGETPESNGRREHRRAPQTQSSKHVILCDMQTF